MKKIYIGISALVIMGAAITLVVSRLGQLDSKPHTMTNGQSKDSEASVPQNQVYIKDFLFNPAKLTIKKGTTVTWTNKDSARHDISPTMPTNAFVASKLLLKGEQYSYTFSEPGTYNYNCSPHPYMKGTIEVTE